MVDNLTMQRMLLSVSSRRSGLIKPKGRVTYGEEAERRIFLQQCLMQ